ncbi:MAG: biotin--[Bacteroidales bacterium]|nr:biotin--[acetyl-CoA-carboxylase] ligase [Bacteroidales bacterium]
MKLDMTTIWLDTVDSTQEEIKRRLGNTDNLTVVAAMFQTAGKGQRGNKWSSGRGENLTFSLLLLPGRDGIREIPAKEQFYISIVSSLAIKELLDEYGLRPNIKWPNDIYIGNKKICGMLIENVLSPSGMVESSIIGIGLNVNQTEFPPQLMNPVSMAKVTYETYDIKSVLERFCLKFTSLLEEEPDVLRQRYLDCLFRFGVKADYTDTKTGETFSGTIRGIDGEALLYVEMPDGEMRKFAFKEISYIL